MTPPRSAEDLADAVIVKWINLYVNGSVQNPDKLRLGIVGALKDYAEERVREARDQHHEGCPIAYEKGHALGFREGVESAANLADDNYPLKKASYVVAEDIRALLPPSAEKE